jgi:ABC-2 type transport system permease protein
MERMQPMNPSVAAEGEAPGARAGAGAAAPVRPLPWSIRREIWENPSLYVAPLAVAALLLSGFVIRSLTLPRRMQAILALDPGPRRETLMLPFNVVAGLLVVTAFLVGAFYCLDALYGERRDRSILFWKSLPVSDLTTVLAKASIPLVVLPSLVVAIVIPAQLALFALGSLVLLGNPEALVAFWRHVPLFQSWIAFVYAAVAIALWHAPVYAWLLLVSAWARRAALLWAVLPFVALGVVERVAFDGSKLAALIGHRLAGWFPRAFVVEKDGHEVVEPLAAMTPVTFLVTPGLWLGLLFAAAFLAAAVRLRRYREPI